MKFVPRKLQSHLRLPMLLAMMLFCATGANCRQWTRSYVQPRTLPESATLEQVMNAVNDNTARVQSLQSTQASLSIPGVPSLRANVALQMPQRLRLRADGPLGGGPELDLGNNDEMFWLWVRRNQPPAMFFCRHEQFAASSARQIMPVEPEWLIEALGLVRFDPSQPHEGPKPVGNGRVEVRTHRSSSMGEFTKITILDEWDGTVLEQHLYDAQGQRIATALTSKFKRDPASGAALPRSIEIQWPTAQMSFHLDVTDWQVNAIAADNLAMWTKPEYPGYPNIDLADPNLRFSMPGTPPAAASTTTPIYLPSGSPSPLPPISQPPISQSQFGTPGTAYQQQQPTVVYPNSAQMPIGGPPLR